MGSNFSLRYEAAPHEDLAKPLRGASLALAFISWSTLKEVTFLDVPLLQGKEARIQAVCTKGIKYGKKLEW